MCKIGITHRWGEEAESSTGAAGGETMPAYDRVLGLEVVMGSRFRFL